MDWMVGYGESFRCCLFLGTMSLLVFLSCVEDFGIWPDGLLDAYSAMIPKTDGDATPLGQRPLSVLPVVYRIWASAKHGSAGGLVSVLGSGFCL